MKTAGRYRPPLTDLDPGHVRAMDLSPGHVGSLVGSRRARQPLHFPAPLEERWRFVDFSLVPGGRAQSHMRPPRLQGQADSPPFLHRVSITLCFCSLFYSRFEANHKVEQTLFKTTLESRFGDLPRFAAGTRIGSDILHFIVASFTLYFCNCVSQSNAASRPREV